ncbi:MAG: metallophosphoesterase [Planctomycetes bacterium]|nr:metallophosphoesterase [Planctomycetota bacterium]
MPEARLLCVGDMHLGRRPSRLPLGAPDGLGPRETWGEVVETAIAREVDAVLLAGDVVESANGALEAYGELLAGARRLREAGIDLVAVAGNLRRARAAALADELPDAPARLRAAAGPRTSCAAKAS